MPHRTFKHRLTGLVLICCLFESAAEPALAGCELEVAYRARVQAVVDGETVELDNGEQVRLAGIFVPSPGNGDQMKPADPAISIWAENLVGRDVDVSFDRRRRDRYGRQIGHLMTDDGTSLQAEVLSKGLALVFTRSDNTACARAYLAAESEARQAGRGLWHDGGIAVRQALAIAAPEAPDLGGTFQIVDGIPVAVTSYGRKTFINFEENWRTDFTLLVRKGDRKVMEPSGIVPEDLAGRRIRVRGMIVNRNGPQIELTHPEQIKVLE